MSKGGRLTKLKSVIKRWHSMSSSNSRLSRANVTSIVAANPSDSSVLSPEKITPEGGLRPVYVGKSRRRYLVSSDLIDHPLFQELLVEFYAC
uniref:Uncharacterized protein n=1 Tax=Nelumbo nucifera TaxID=4432 RepID=A0A823A1D3_NELNU|nr:TPA_asm: hypothetical protein HUJ06_019056 [Nelumbo nucifera]